MITRVAEFLEALKEKETEALKKFEKIGHAPTIGLMYEGLTKDILNKSIFSEIDIRIVSGKITNTEGVYSDQIDCMIVEGEGERIPYTKDYIYHISKVIAVIEVKKNLYSSNIEAAYHNLRSVVNIYESKSVNLYMLSDSYRSFTNHKLPKKDEYENMSIEDQMIYSLIVEEATLPIRIVIGYNGFSSEYSLRNSFIEHLKKNVTIDLDHINLGYGVISFPNIIICDNLSLVKLNGMPFALKVQYGDEYKEGDFYHIYGSFSKNPILLLLELIWTRLSYQYKLPASIFGDDLNEEIPHPLLECKIIQREGHTAWEYKYHDLNQEFLDSLGSEKEWEPCVLDDAQGVLINYLCSKGTVSVNHPLIDELLNDEPKYKNKDEFINSVKATYLVDVDKENKFYLLTEECQVLFLPDGRVVAAENNTGRLTRWFRKYSQEN